MSIENQRQLENAQLKLHELQKLYARTAGASCTDLHVRELTMRSISKRLNQFKEEIARFEAQSVKPYRTIEQGIVTAEGIPKGRPREVES